MERDSSPLLRSSSLADYIYMYIYIYLSLSLINKYIHIYIYVRIYTHTKAIALEEGKLDFVEIQNNFEAAKTELQSMAAFRRGLVELRES